MQNRKLDEYQLSGAGKHKQVVLKKDLVEYRRKKQAIKHLMRDKEMAALEGGGDCGDGPEADLFEKF